MKRTRREDEGELTRESECENVCVAVDLPCSPIQLVDSQPVYDQVYSPILSSLIPDP